MPNLQHLAPASRRTLPARLRVGVLATVLSLSALSSAAIAETGQFDSNGVPIHFVDEGTGETVIFLHGFAGSSDLWPAVGLLPLDGFRTVAFDARGHGRSGKPTDRAAYGRELVDDVVRLMDARGIEAAHFVGYSMGAETALALATQHESRVLSIVAGGSGWSGEAEAQSYGFIASALSEATSFGDFMAAMAPADQKLPPEAEAAMMDLLATHGIDPAQSSAPLAAFAAGLPEIISIDASALSAIWVPVLGIAGEDDPERANIEALVQALPTATLTIVASADHLTAPVMPNFAEAIIGFLDD